MEKLSKTEYITLIKRMFDHLKINLGGNIKVGSAVNILGKDYTVKQVNVYSFVLTGAKGAEFNVITQPNVDVIEDTNLYAFCIYRGKRSTSFTIDHNGIQHKLSKA